jgi:hypothetical protein
VIDWTSLLVFARAAPVLAIRAVTYDGPVPGSGSQAQFFTCDDGFTYSVKFIGNPHGTRILATEQVVAALALYLDAPVPSTAHVEVAQTLIEANHLLINGVAALPGVHHGSRWEQDCSGRLWIEHGAEPLNRPRFAALCVLYTWVGASDHQLIYQNASPHLVFSVDHGHFLAGGPGWSAATLQTSPAPSVDAQFAPLSLDESSLRPYVQRLAAITPEVVAGCLARVHSTWGVIETDLVALGEYIVQRAVLAVQLFP